MPLLLWDASALCKRYTPEIGSSTVNALFQQVPAANMITTVVSYAESCSVLNRRRNGGVISESIYRTARSALRAEVIGSADFSILPVDFFDFLQGVPLLERHNLNASDAAVLSAYSRHSASAAVTVKPAILIASDLRLLRAALHEGLVTLNPESVSPSDVLSVLASLAI